LWRRALLSALFARDFEGYFAQAGSSAPLWLFVHVPKTAGSSIETEARAILAPSVNLDIDHTDTERSYQARFDAAVGRFVAAYPERKERFASGHINDRQVEAIRTGIAGVRCFTMLRHPIGRLISDYRYQRSAMNLAQEEFVRTTPSFEAYAARRHVHNKMAAHLVPRPMLESGDVDACVAYMLDRYAFIGLQEMYPLSLRVLTTLLGEPRAASAQLRVNPETEETRVTLSAAHDLELRGRNAIDLGIFQAFTGRWRGIRTDLREFLRRQPNRNRMAVPA
jgi:hypothetical protein